MSSTNSERKIRDIRDVWGCQNENQASLEKDAGPTDNSRTKSKYKTLERHLSMKKTIRKKMMRDLREIGDAAEEAPGGFLDKLRTEQQPPANIDKPSLWKRLTKGWSGGS